VALKKPSEYFKKESTSVSNSVQELVKTPELNTFSDAFESFKKNLGKIEVLSEFSETLDNYRINIERVNHLSEKVEDIQNEIQNLLKKEDLDRAIMSQLLVVEQSIQDLQNKVKGINEKNLTEIRLDVAGLTESVNEFLEVEVPKYKKLVVDSELRTNGRYEELETNINSTLEGIGEFVDKKYEELTESLQGINENSLSGIVEDFKKFDEAVLELKEQEIPKYKGFIVETERKTEVKLDEFSQKLDKTLVNFDEKVQESIQYLDDKVAKKIGIFQDSIEEIDEKFIELKEQEIPKYKRFIVEAEKKTESKLNEFDEKLDTTISEVLEVVNSVEVLNSDTERKISKKIEDVQDLQTRVDVELKNVEEHKEKLSKKVTDLEVEIVRNENHIKSQNEYIENIQEEVRDVISKLQVEKLEEKNHELTKKIKYLEEIFEKFNEKEILSENIIVEPPQVKTEDPLTPLDRNFVTLDQLNQHYRLFLNRIQQQLATIGGGGETQLKYLDDIVGIATNASAYNNKFLKYNHSIGKFEFVSVGAGSQNLDETLQLGNTSSFGMSVGVTTVTSLNVDSVANFDTNTITFSSSSPTQIYSFSASQYRSARLQIQITQGTDYQTSDILLIHNGSSVNIVEYASISTNDYLGTFDALVSNGNVSLRVLMGSSSSSTIKVVSQTISL
jgi:DNA repair exonuclease SbcCD ATPase subunit